MSHIGLLCCLILAPIYPTSIHKFIHHNIYFTFKLGTLYTKAVVEDASSDWLVFIWASSGGIYLRIVEFPDSMRTKGISWESLLDS